MIGHGVATGITVSQERALASCRGILSVSCNSRSVPGAFAYPSAELVPLGISIPKAFATAIRLMPLVKKDVSIRYLPEITTIRCSSSQEKKPTWPNTLGYSTTSAYSSTSPPAKPGCPSSSRPTSRIQVFIGADCHCRPAPLRLSLSRAAREWQANSLEPFVITPIRHEDRRYQFVRRRQEAVRGTLTS